MSYYECEHDNHLLDYTFIVYVDLDTNKRNMFRCIAIDDNDAQSQFYAWCDENNIHGNIVEIN